MPLTLEERVLGCLLGGAIGDALGNPIEFSSLIGIQTEYGPDGLTTMIDTDITDDTQMTLFTAEGLIRAELHGGDRLTAVHDAYLRWYDTQQYPGPQPPGEGHRSGWLREQAWLYARRAPGNACLSGLRSGKRPEVLPGETGPVNLTSKGCGTVMRSAPFGLTGEDPFDLAARCSYLTHGHPTAALSAGAFALIVHRLLQGDPLLLAVHHALDRLPEYPSHEETAAALRAAVELAEAGDPAPQQVERLGAAWIAEEALAIAVYCALVEPDPRAALILAVNHSGDSDSTGAVCGNLLGAWYGAAALPTDWADKVEGTETIRRLAADLTVVFGERRLLSRYPRA